MLTTRRRLASARRFCASKSPSSMRLASLISSSADSKGTRPISLRYILTGSSILMPSGILRSISISSSSLISEVSSSGPISLPLSMMSIPRLVKVSYNSSISSGLISTDCSDSMISLYVKTPVFLPLSNNLLIASKLAAELAVFVSLTALTVFFV